MWPTWRKLQWHTQVVQHLLLLTLWEDLCTLGTFEWHAAAAVLPMLCLSLSREMSAQSRRRGCFTRHTLLSFCTLEAATQCCTASPRCHRDRAALEAEIAQIQKIPVELIHILIKGNIFLTLWCIKWKIQDITDESNCFLSKAGGLVCSRSSDQERWCGNTGI